MNTTEGAYIPIARNILTLQEAQSSAKKKLLELKRACASQMHSVGVRSFSFKSGDRHFHATLKRPQAERVNTTKLYVLLAEGTITRDEFLDCVVAPLKAVEETLGEKVAHSLLETYEKGLDLIIEEG